MPLSRRALLGAGAALAGAHAAQGAVWRAARAQAGDEPAPAVIVGCGGSGIAAATALICRGIPVVCLESGPLPDARARSAVPFGAPDEPFVVGAEPFEWVRLRQVGGKLARWLGHCPRFSPDDFSAGREQSADEAWPIGYAELEPYYRRMERILGVTGAPAGLPDLPDGEFAGALALRPIDVHLAPRLERLGIRLTPGRFALVEGAWLASEFGRRPVPPRAGGGPRLALFDSVDYVRSALLADPLFGLVPNAHALRVELGADGKIAGVLYLDKATGEQRTLRCRSVLLAAGALESAVLLLASRSDSHPAGLGNGSDLVGRFLNEHIQLGVGFDVSGVSAAAAEGASGLPNAGNWGALIHLNDARVAPELRGPYAFQVLSRALPDGSAAVFLNGMGLVDPQAESRIHLTGRTTPQGLPIPELRFELGARTQERVQRMVSAALLILSECGGAQATPVQRAPFGTAMHYAGTCRMGRKGSSVLDSFGQCHEVENLFVVDAGAFVTSPPKNPTLTMMALATRAADFLAQRLRSG